MAGLTKFWCFEFKYIDHSAERARDDLFSFCDAHNLARHMSTGGMELRYAKKPTFRLVAFGIDLPTNSMRGAAAGPEDFVERAKDFLATLPVRPNRPIGFSAKEWWHGIERVIEPEDRPALKDAEEVPS